MSIIRIPLNQWILLVLSIILIEIGQKLVMILTGQLPGILPRGILRGQKDARITGRLICRLRVTAL